MMLPLLRGMLTSNNATMAERDATIAKRAVEKSDLLKQLTQKDSAYHQIVTQDCFAAN